MKASLRKELEKLTKLYELSREVSLEKSLKQSLKEKRIIVDELKQFLTNYKTLILLDATETPSKLYMHLKQKYGELFCVRMVKNKLLLKALAELGMSNVEEVARYLHGQNIAIFTNLNAFEAKLIIDRTAVSYKVKPGDRIEHEIIIPPMRTELKPGPMMSLFGKLKIPIQVKDGVIWIMREATIARPGDTVTQEMVSLFDKLGIEPKLLKPKIKLAYEKGLVIPSDKLIVDIEGTKNSLIDGIKNAMNIAVEIVVPEPSIIELAISRAYTRACRLAVEAGIINKDTAPLIFSLALARAYALASSIAQKVPDLISVLPSTQSTSQQLEVKEEKKEEKEEKEKKSEVAEEQLAEGLAALFG